MPYERLLTRKQTAPSPCGRLPEFGRLWQFVVLLYALLATLALCTLVQAPPGIQHLLLLCIVRLSVLVCIGAVSYRAHSRQRQRAPQPASGSSPPSPRATLVRAALYLQVAWLASEVLLGCALLLFYPRNPGAQGSIPTSNTTGTLLTFLPLACALVMSGCFLFLQRFAARRRRQHATAPSLECGSMGALRGVHSTTAGSSAPCCSTGCPACSYIRTQHSSVDILCSPVSESGSFSSCTSAASSAAFYSRSSTSSLGLSGSGSGGMPSPTGHVRSMSEETTAHHQAALQAACQILLVEHQLDTKEYCLFVHKKLRPIKTRLEGGAQGTPAARLAARAHH